MAVREVQRIVVGRLEAREAFAATLDRRGVPQKAAQRITQWLTERMTPSERADASMSRPDSEGLYQINSSLSDTRAKDTTRTIADH